MRITGPGIWGPPPSARRPRRRDRAAAARGRARRQLLRHRRFLRAERQRGADRGGARALRRARRRDQGRPDALRPRRLARRTGGRSTCAARSRAACGACRLERIDLYQFHRPDPAVPFEESLGALVEARGEGKIRHIGLSNVTLDAARAGARDDRDRLRAEPLQRARSLAARQVLDACTRARHRVHPVVPAGRRRGDRRAAGALEGVARAHDATSGQIALAWLLAVSPVDAADSRHLADRPSRAERRRRPTIR